MERWAGDAAPIKSSNYVTAVRFTDSRQSSGVCVHAEQNGRSRRAAFRDGRPTFAVSARSIPLQPNRPDRAEARYTQYIRYER